jgi:hypothetical protein
MRKRVVCTVAILAMVIGCTSHLSFKRNSTNDIPFDRRRPPSLDQTIIIKANGPQLDPKYYEIMGKVTARIENPTALRSHCKDAADMLRYEAQTVGADALVNVSCSSDTFGASATATAIAFRNKEEALKILREIKAILE